MGSSLILLLTFSFLIVIGFGLLLAWLIIRLTRRLSGNKGSWKDLALLYPARMEVPGEKLNRQTLAIGPVVYKNCVSVVFSPLGFYLATWIKKEAILLPWDQIQKTGEKSLYWRKHLLLSVGLPEVSNLTVPEVLFQKMQVFMDH